jgi:C4-dicarboxylate transporter DctM subunit
MKKKHQNQRRRGKMKRIITLLLATVMCLALCACGTTSTTPTASPAGTATGGSASYDKVDISLTCNGQSDKANDVIGSNLFKQYIEEQSGGAISVTVYNNDQLAGGDMTKGLELVVDGTVQIDIHSTSIISNLDKRLMVSALPWTFSSYDEAEEAFFGAGGEFDASVLAEHGLTYLGALHNGFKAMTCSKKQITCPADLVGLKIRTPGGDLWNGFWTALGASPQAMSWSEVYSAMQQGTVDGHDNSLSTINSANVQEVQHYITISNHTYEAFTWTANTAWFDSLSTDTQQLIRDCTEQACHDADTQIVANESAIKESFIKDYGCEVYTLSEDEIAEFKAAIADVMATYKEAYGADACAAFGIK